MKNKKTALIVAICAIVVIVVLCIVLTGKKAGEAPDAATVTEAPVTEAPVTEAPTATPEPTEEPYVSFDTAHVALQFPSTYKEYIVHTQETEGDTIHEVFSMVVHNKTHEIFRLSFGASSSGEYLGALDAETNAVPVYSSVQAYTKERLEELGSYDLYYALMDGVNTMLDSLYSNERFVKDAVLISSETQSAQLSHWNVDLPSEMSWEETAEADAYHVDFYGSVAGEKIKLYSVHIDDSEQEDPLGQYLLNGDKKTIYIESYPFEAKEGWTEQEMIAAGSQMDTINKLIPAIIANENYSPNIEPDF